MNEAKKLPDAYRKDSSSNIYKVLQLANLLYHDAKADFESIDISRDLDQASGKTLDYYAAMVGASRNGATDEQLVVKIKNSIGRNFAGSDINSMINAVALMAGVEASNIRVFDEYNQSVIVTGLTVKMLEDSGYSSSEFTEMVSGFMPVGVELPSVAYAGTLTTTDRISLVYNYPVLWWACRAMADAPPNTGLSGTVDPDDVPSELRDYYPNTVTTYQGGTLGILTGED